MLFSVLFNAVKYKDYIMLGTCGSVTTTTKTTMKFDVGKHQRRSSLSIPEQYTTDDNIANITYEHHSCKAGLWGGPAGQLPGVPICKRC